MKRKTRRLLLVAATVFFIFFSYIAILYAQGYKYSFYDGKFFRTGAIDLSLNTDASIYINDNSVGTTSFLRNTFSKSGLLPGKYTIRVSRDEYTSWQKKITIEEGFVVDFPKVMILSTNEEERVKLINEIESQLYPFLSPSPSTTPVPAKTLIPTPTSSIIPTDDLFYITKGILYKNDQKQSEVIDKNVIGFILTQNKSQIAWFNTNNEIWSMWLKNSDYQPYHKSDDKELITRLSTKIKNIGWFRGNDHIAVDSLGYRIVEIDTRGGINIIKL